MNKRFTIKPQDDYFGITDNNTADKVNVINGIRTEIEAKWLCGLLNELYDENSKLHIQNDFLKDENQHMRTVLKENKELKEENQQLRELLEYGLEVSQVEIDEELRRIKND